MPRAMALLVAAGASAGATASSDKAVDAKPAETPATTEPKASEPKPRAEKRAAAPPQLEAKAGTKPAEKRARRRDDGALARVTAPTAFDEVRWELRPLGGAPRIRLAALRTSGKMTAEIVSKFVRSNLGLDEEREVELSCAGVPLRPEMTLDTLVKKVWPTAQGHLVLEYSLSDVSPPQTAMEEEGEEKEENKKAKRSTPERKSAEKEKEPPAEEPAPQP